MATSSRNYQRIFTSYHAEEFLMKFFTTLLLALGAVVILIPFVFMLSIALKDSSQIRSDPISIIPRKPLTVSVNGEDLQLYKVNVNGSTSQMALLKNAPGKKGIFIDPAHPDQT